MTIIAVKGDTMVADKQSTFSGVKTTATKIRRIGDGSLVGCAGDSCICRALMEWFDAGCDGPWPDPGDKCVALRLMPDGRILRYESGIKTPTEVEDSYHAIGSGTDFAMAALYLGHTVIEAVQAACALSTGCGMGIDVLRLDPVVA